MSAVEIKKGVYWVGVKDPDLEIFDIIMSTKNGTTYNSYLIVDEKIVLIDTVKDGFYEEYIAGIKEVIGDRKIDYIVVNHTEPDHSGSLNRVLEEYKDAVVYASRAALMNIRQIINSDFKGVEAKEDLNIGERTLRFISAPLLHWPDTMFTYDEKDAVIFTCDGFGCHYCSDRGVYNDEVGDFSEEFKYYYDVIMGPFKKNVLSAIEKIRTIKIDIIAPSHGPIHREKPMQYVDIYEEWSRNGLPKSEEKSAVVVFVSAYGYTKSIAVAIAEGIKESGVKVELFDAQYTNPEVIVGKIDRSNAVAVGSPTINQDAVKPVWDVLSLICPIINRTKPALAFGSYGWSGESITLINERLKGLKFKTIENGLKVLFKPSEDDLKKAREMGRQLGEQIK